MPKLGLGLTNAAYRTTRGSSDLRRGDFAGAAKRLESVARELRPKTIAFVGKAAYEGTFREGPRWASRHGSSTRAPLRPALDLTRERSSSIQGAPALVP
jgi:hypothetical protein